MILGFRHKGLSRLHERGESRGVPSRLAPKLLRVLDRLDIALVPNDMDLPGYRLHPLKGERRGQWSVTVSGNWRVVFAFAEGGVVDVDLVDYH